jgi:hypothetical protein
MRRGAKEIDWHGCIVRPVWRRPSPAVCTCLLVRPDIVSKVARIHGDDTHSIIDELRLIIRENVVRLVDESGLAQ